MQQCVHGLAALASIWLRALSRRSVPHQLPTALAHGPLYFAVCITEPKYKKELHCIMQRVSVLL